MESQPIEDQAAQKTKVEIPEDASGKTIHIILELNDNGQPNLYAYRRVVIEVKSLRNIQSVISLSLRLRVVSVVKLLRNSPFIISQRDKLRPVISPYSLV